MNIDNSTIDINTNTNLKDIDSTSRLIDEQAFTIFQKIDDLKLGISFIKIAINKLGFGQVAGIAQFAIDVVNKDGGNAGKVFVSVCNKAMKSPQN